MSLRLLTICLLTPIDGVFTRLTLIVVDSLMFPHTEYNRSERSVRGILNGPTITING